MQEPDDSTPDADLPQAEAKPERPKRTRRTAAAIAADAQAAQVAQALANGVTDGASTPEAPAPVTPPARKTARRSAKVAPVDAEVASQVSEAVASESVEKPAASPIIEPSVHGIFQLADAPEPASFVVEPATAEGSDGRAPQAPSDREPRHQHPREGRRDRHPRGQRRDMGTSGDPAAQPNGAQDGQPLATVGEDDQRPSRRANMLAEQASVVFAELLSGDFDEKYQEEVAEAQEDGAPTKRVLRPEPDAPKLQKVLAQSGVGSRRDIEEMIEEGRITVNDEVAHIGQRISFGDRIGVDGKPIRVRIQPPPARILAYHKPVGEVVTHEDPQDRPTVFRHLPRLQHGKWQSVGRLDLNTEGLLLFSNSGDLANQLMHPRFGVEREYAVRVLGTLTPENKSQLLQGVDIEGQMASFKGIEEGGGEGANRWYRVVITEGRNREVRKLFEAVGMTVSRLIRVRYGAIVLPHGLKRGTWVELGESDVRAIRSLTGGDRQDAPRRNHNDDRQQGRNSRGGRPAGNDRNDRFANNQGGLRQNDGGRGPRPQQDRGPRQAPAGRTDDRPRQMHDDDIDHIGRIPNPLEQTFDRRFATGSKRITAGFGRPDQTGQGPAPRGKGGPREPDPLQTSVGYIGADAFFGNKGGGGGNRGGGRGGSGGGNTGGGRNRR
jgi:23S rRNA pseudouridine2605 synthase